MKRRRLCKQRPYADEYDDPLLEDENKPVKIASVSNLRPAAMKVYAIAATYTLKIDAAVHFMLTTGRAHMHASAVSVAAPISAYKYLCIVSSMPPHRRFFCYN